MNKEAQSIKNWLLIALAIVASPLLLLVGIGYMLYKLFCSLVTHIAIWFFWCRKGIFSMFVYSDSPTSKPYLQEYLIPVLPQSTIILNWSDQKNWKDRFAKSVFLHFGGRKNYCPLGIVFRPFHRTFVFRFWKPFLDFKHGRQLGVEQIATTFLEAIQQAK
jgi:hypothetical protein